MMVRAVSEKKPALNVNTDIKTLWSCGGQKPASDNVNMS